jgi:predicted HTH domain antitoxin
VIAAFSPKNKPALIEIAAFQKEEDMKITIELPDNVAERLTQRVSNLSQKTLEALAVEGYRNELLSHGEVGHILNLGWWEVEAFLKKANAYLHYDEADLARDRETVIQVTPCN